MQTISQIIAIEHAAAEEAARTGDTIANAQMLVRNRAALVAALNVPVLVDYVPTDAERESDRMLDEWKAKQREECRKAICPRLAADRRAAADACAAAYAARVSA